jgi:hypothetical protein
MAKTPEVIVAEIKAHAGTPYSSWYAGIASDPKDRMFKDHCVDEENGGWIYRTAATNAEARTAEAALHTAGFEGGPGGGDSGTKAVYAYKITANTEE